MRNVTHLTAFIHQKQRKWVHLWNVYHCTSKTVQEQLYETSVRSLIERSLLQNVNATIFAYGPTVCQISIALLYLHPPIDRALVKHLQWENTWTAKSARMISA